MWTDRAAKRAIHYCRRRRVGDSSTSQLDGSSATATLVVLHMQQGAGKLVHPPRGLCSAVSTSNAALPELPLAAPLVSRCVS